MRVGRQAAHNRGLLSGWVVTRNFVFGNVVKGEWSVAVDTSIIGTSLGNWKITVERGPVSNFAQALTDDNPIYKDASAANAAGFENVPAPPTFGMSLQHWGTFVEDQPESDGNAMMALMGKLMKGGGLILHGEQEFEYHRPMVAGDVLLGEGSVTDAYEKEGKGKTMTFIVMSNDFRSEATGEPVLTARMNLIISKKTAE